ncbi:cupin domain-containing protein [Orrella sp. 11846]|uniref:cupin domain-containing protein n=1 Tax=Orrella sp. 11846 TaxID=3409913 RepID=UPI003B5C1481
MLSGSVTFWAADREKILNQGDSAHFPASIPHKIQTRGDQPASVLLVTLAGV